MYKFTYSIVATALLFVGCGNAEESKQQASVETVISKKSEPKTEVAQAEMNIAKIPSTTAPVPLQKKGQKEPQKRVEASTADGGTLYKSCAGCHGAKGEKSALGKSEIISGWSALKVEEALKEYRAKTRNVHGMGALMQGQAAKLNDAEIKALGAYIEKLK